MEDLERYQIVDEVLQEWGTEKGNNLDFPAWISKRLQPVDPREETFNELRIFLQNGRPKDDDKGFSVFKKLFPEGNGTMGLDAAFNMIDGQQTGGRSEYNKGLQYACDFIKVLKKELES